MPKAADALPRQAERTTIVKDTVPAPPLPANAELFPDAGGPPPSAQTEEGFDAFLLLRSLRPEDWANYMVYLYWTPAGQRRLGANIDVITEPITLEWVKKKFGGSAGGRFIIWVNRVTEPVWRRTHEFEIEGERIFEGKPTNAMPAQGTTTETTLILNALNRLADRFERQPDLTAKDSLDMATTAYRTSLQTIASQPPAAAKGEESMLLTLITLFEKMGMFAKRGNDTIATLKELKELGILPGASAASDPLKMVETFGKVVAAVKEMNPGDGDGGDWKARAVQIAADLVPRVPGIVADIAKAAEWNARGQAQNATPTPTNPTPGGTAGAPVGPESTAPPPAPPFDMESFLWERVAFMIATDNDGDQIAQYLHFSTAGTPDPETGKVPSIIAHFLPFTPEGLLTLLDSKPAIQKALEGKNKRQIAEHFLHYCQTGELIDEDEDFPDQDPETPPAAQRPV